MVEIDGEYIEIVGDLAQLVERRIIRQVPLEVALKKVIMSTPVTLPTIARSQVFGHYDPNFMGMAGHQKLFVLSEISAGIKNISKNVHGRGRRYRLDMPWTYLWFGIDSSGANIWNINDYLIFHALDRYSGIDTPMIVARLPNVYSDGRICWGATGVDPSMPLADRIDKLTNEWYLSRFNTDLDGSVPLPYNEPNFRRWVEESRASLGSWKNWPEWTDTGVEKITVRTLLEEAGATPQMERIVLPNAIPEVPLQMTFGRWDEWWRMIPPEQRTRALTSLENLRLDDPENVPEVDHDYETIDDGGVEIDEPYDDGDDEETW